MLEITESPNKPWGLHMHTTLTRAHGRSAATLREHPTLVNQSSVVKIHPIPRVATESPQTAARIPQPLPPEFLLLRPLLSFFSSFTLCCFFALSAPSAQAEETGNHYDPERVMGQSALFTQLNKTQLKLVGPLESAMKRMDGALADLDLNVGLTGEAVDVAARELWAARLEQRAGEFSTFFDAFQDRFSEDGAAYQVIFLGALDRAVQSLKDETGVDVSECASNKNPFGMAGPGGMAAKTCQGEDLSARIAGMWDQDPELKAALVELGKKAWPTLASYETDTEVALVRGGGAAPDGWIAPSQLVKLVPEASELLFTIEVRTEDGRRALLEE